MEWDGDIAVEHQIRIIKLNNRRNYSKRTVITYSQHELELESENKGQKDINSAKASLSKPQDHPSNPLPKTCKNRPSIRSSDGWISNQFHQELYILYIPTFTIFILFPNQSSKKTFQTHQTMIFHRFWLNSDH